VQQPSFRKLLTTGDAGTALRLFRQAITFQSLLPKLSFNFETRHRSQQLSTGMGANSIPVPLHKHLQILLPSALSFSCIPFGRCLFSSNKCWAACTVQKLYFPDSSQAASSLTPVHSQIYRRVLSEHARLDSTLCSEQILQLIKAVQFF
jgi:hypothetical protein